MVSGLPCINLFFEKQLVSLLQPGLDKSNWRDVDGLVGMQALRHFHLSTDTKNKSLWMAPNGLNFPMKNAILCRAYGSKSSGTNIARRRCWNRKSGGGGRIESGRQDCRTGFCGDDKKILSTPGKSVSFDYERDGKRASVEYTLRPISNCHGGTCPSIRLAQTHPRRGDGGDGSRDLFTTSIFLRLRLRFSLRTLVLSDLEPRGAIVAKAG